MAPAPPSCHVPASTACCCCSEPSAAVMPVTARGRRLAVGRARCSGSCCCTGQGAWLWLSSPRLMHRHRASRSTRPAAAWPRLLLQDARWLALAHGIVLALAGEALRCRHSLHAAAAAAAPAARAAVCRRGRAAAAVVVPSLNWRAIAPGLAAAMLQSIQRRSSHRRATEWRCGRPACADGPPLRAHARTLRARYPE